MNKDNKNEIILFENQDIKLEVNMQDETVWLNTEQMAQLFDRDYKTIRKHINNTLKEELKDEAVVAKFENTTEHGAIQGKTQTHMVEYYNLDMIISVGYRVKSDNCVIFRKWANKILKEYLIKGYVVNQKRLEYLEKTIQLIEEKGANFLYLVVKNHVFADGNKRIAATLFIYFLNFYGILYKEGKQTIDNNTLTANIVKSQEGSQENNILITSGIAVRGEVRFSKFTFQSSLHIVSPLKGL